METLYDRLGGETTLHALVNVFYNKVLHDLNLKKKFVETDMESLKAHQIEFMTFVFGGSKHYPIERIAEAHKNLKIQEHQYAAVCMHLQQSMRELEVDDVLISEVMEIVGTTHDMI
ncbi:MAG: group 1 truncated hemoglobin, partial [Alphaproteobacteria bacterium]|nr:group 1 truncated hemoglobin [Alphaproteobacteria bacterium]